MSHYPRLDFTIPTVLALVLFTALTAAAGPDNIAPNAKVTASSIFNDSYAAGKAIDGIIRVHASGEWACRGDTTDWGYVRFPWINLEWTSVQKINRVVLYDRPSLREHIAGGKLLFSDGSVIWVNQIPNDGTGLAVSFGTKSITWMRFVATDGTGRDLGFSEIEVFPSPEQFTDYASLVDPYKRRTGEGISFLSPEAGRSE